MRPVLTLLLLLAIGSLSAQNWGNRTTVKGNGDVVTQERDVSDFDGISACCSLNVELRKGSHGVKVEAESNIQEYIRTEVRGGRLQIGYKNNVNVKQTMKITVYVSVPELDYIGASSSSKVSGKDRFSGDDLELDVSSSATIEFAFSGDRVDADASSSGKIFLKGKGNRIKANVSSGAKIRAGEYMTKRARAGASSGGGVTVHASEELIADASSGGSVRYTGSPSTVDSDTSSGGRVRRDN
ncbi:MAG: head GIN domain-containing protein [Bacteroidota bacterium]